MRMFNPSHPGDFIRSEMIEPLGLSVTAAAKVLGVSRPALSAFLNGRASLSGEMAVRIQQAFGLKADTMLRMQNNYDIAQARIRYRHIRVRRYRARNTRQRARRTHR